MNRSKHDCYLEALETFRDWVTVGEWAIKVAEMFPEILKQANEQASKHKNETTGLREIRARIASRVSTGGFKHFIKIDESESPKKILYFKLEASDSGGSEEEEFKREEIEFQDMQTWNEDDRYRYDELKKIRKSLSDYMGVSLALDHAKAIGNKDERGLHHPNNLQILIHGHNSKKSNSSWKRFTLEEQIEYLRKIVESYDLIATVNNLEIEDKTIERLFDRLKSVY